LQAVILCGGLGTRLGDLAKDVPKAMMPVANRPFLEYELELLKRGGVNDFVLCTGHLGEVIERHFGDGTSFGINVSYSHDGAALRGPAGALKRASRLLRDEFFVTYGDAYLRVDYRSVMDRLLESGTMGVMTVYKNEGRHGKSDLVVRRGRVVKYDKKDLAPGMKWINYGVSALSKRALALIPSDRFCGEEEFYGNLIDGQQLLAYPVGKRFYEIGTPSALREFTRFISTASRKKTTAAT
jgi:NDP-sugar pyrophosphorylase family protein